MKKVLSVCLILCTLLSLLVPAASAAVTGDAANMTDLQKAVVETALAYYYKGNAVQYGSYYLDKGGRYTSAVHRLTTNRQPEDSSVDDTHYSVCSGFPHDTYYAAFGMHVINSERQPLVTEIKGALHPHTPYYNGMDFTEEELNYEYGIHSDTSGYTGLGRWYAERGENPDGMVVAYWGPTSYYDDGSAVATSCADQNWETVRDMLQPGDIITANCLNASSDDETSGELDTDSANTSTAVQGLTFKGGHSMMFLGDIFGDGRDYVIHSTGAKYNGNDMGDRVYYDDEGSELFGYDILEAPASSGTAGSGLYKYNRNGTITIQPYESLMGIYTAADGTDKEAGYYIPNCYDFTILRPIKAMTATDLTPQAKFRLHHPGLAITKTADVKPYRDVMAGDTITYTIKFENNTKDEKNVSKIGAGTYGAVAQYNWNRTYKDLVLTETLPAGATLVSATSGYTKSGSTLTWNVGSLKPGSSNTRTITYTVKVAGTTEQVVSPRGTITVSGKEGYLDTKELTHEVVSRQLDAAEVAAITASSVTASTAALRSGTDVAEDVYAAMGYALDLPDGQQIVDMICTETPFVLEATSRWQVDFQLVDADQLQTDAARTLREMIVPGFVGGQRLFTADENGVRSNKDRLRVLNEDFVQPGDVLVFMNGARHDGTIAQPTNGNTFNRATPIVQEKAYVYLGSSNWASYEDGTLTVVNDPIVIYEAYSTSTQAAIVDASKDIGSHTSGGTGSYSRKYSHSNILHQAFLQDLFLLLRPSRVGLTAMDVTKNTMAVELQSGGSSTYYADLKSAAKAAADGDTIVLHEDLTLTSEQTINAGVTLDLNGHTVTAAAAIGETLTSDTLRLYSGTLKNGTVDGVVYVSSKSTVRIENVTLLGRAGSYTPTGYSWARNGAALVYASGTSITLKNVSIASRSYTALPIQAGKDGTTYGSITIEDDVKVLVPEGYMAAEADTIQTATGLTWDYGSMKLGTGVGAYVGTALRSLDGLTRGDAASVGYRAYTFTKSWDVCNQDTETYYPSLTEAVRNVSAGETLVLQRDVDASDFDEAGMRFSDGNVTYLVSATKKMTLDLNGHTIRDDMMPSGTVIVRSGQNTVTVKNGTVESHKTAFNCGSLTLEKMTVYCGNTAVAVSGSGPDGQTIWLRNSTICGGMKGGGLAHALSCDKGTVTIRSSTLCSNTGETIYAAGGGITLEEATVMAHMYTYNSVGAVNAAQVTVADGYIQTGVRQQKTLACDGRELTFLADVYGVQADVAAIDGRKYAYVERALENAVSGDTVTVTADTIISENVTVSAGVTLDTGEHTVALAEGKYMTVSGTVTGNAVSCTSAVYLILEGDGSYLGITIPENLDVQTVSANGLVHPDPRLNADYALSGTGAVKIQGTVKKTYGKENYIFNTATQDKAAIGRASLAFSLDSVAAKELGDDLSLVPVGLSTSTCYVGKTETVSTQALAEAELANAETSEARCRVLVAMLDYGAAAQTKFDHNTGTLANANMGAYSAYRFPEAELAAQRQDKGVLYGEESLFRGTSCILGSSPQMKLYFHVPANADELTYTVQYGTTTLSGPVSELEKTAGGEYGFLLLNGLDLKDFDAEVAITVSQNGEAVVWGTDSIQSYLARLHQTGETGLANAILAYAMAVKDLG